MAQTHGPSRSGLIFFLLHNVCRTLHSLPTAVPGLRPGWDLLFLTVCEMINQSPEKGWPHDHGPTNVRAMVKKHFKVVLCTLKLTNNSEHLVFTFQQSLPFVSCWRIPGQWVSKWSWIIGHSHLFEETDLKLDGVALLITDPSQRGGGGE